MTDIASLGYEVDSTQLERGTRALDANAKAAERTAAAAEKVGTSYQAVSRASAPVDALANAHVRLKDAYDRENGVRTRLAAYMSSERGMRLAQVQALNSQAKAMDATAVSAGQLSAALRGVPAQFTDIVTALQGGQSPMQVLFQQGGQLKDQFGGIGAAARGLAGYIAGLVNPLSITAAAVASYAYALQSAQKDTSALVNALSATGNYVGATVGQVDMLVESMAELEGVTHGGARAALLAVAESGRLAGDQFAMVAEIAARMEAATGQSIDTTIQKFEEIAKDPVEALLRLNETEHFLTAAHLSRMDALIAEGREQDAAAYGASVYRDRLDEVAKAAENARPHLSQMLTEVNKLASATLEGAKNFAEFLAATAQVTRQRPSWQQYGLAGGFNYLRDMYNAKPAEPVQIPRVAGTTNSTRERERRREAEAAERDIARQIESMYGLDTAVNKLEKSFGSMSETRQAAMKADGTYTRLLNRAMEEDAKREEARRKAAAPKKTDEQREAEQLQRSYESLSGQMTRQIALYGKVGEAAKVSYDVQYGALKGLSQARKDELIRQAQQIDDQRIEAQFQSQVATLEREIALFGERGRAAALAYDMQAAGLDKVNPKLAESLREMAAWRDWQDEMAAVEDVWADVAAEHTKLSLKVKDDLDFMTTAAQQAGRNMQDAFADFLFDPFKDGAEGMLENFGKVLQRMAAEMAASQVFKMLGNWGQTNAGAGGWQGALAGIVSGLFGPSANGGREFGGYVSKSGMYRVGERNKPEVLSTPSGSYLIPGDSGRVDPIPMAPAPARAAAAPVFNLSIVGGPEPESMTSRPNASGGLDMELIYGQLNKRQAGDFAAGTGALYNAVKGRLDVRDRM